MCHFVKSTLQGLFRGTLKGFICPELYNYQLLASPSFPVLSWILLMRQLLNPASWVKSLFMRFVLCKPQFPEQAGPCMPKPQSLCPVSETLKANQHSPYPHLLTPPPPAQLSRRLLSSNSNSYSTSNLLFQKRQTNTEMGKQAPSVQMMKFKIIAVIRARSRGHTSIKSIFEIFLLYLFCGDCLFSCKIYLFEPGFEVHSSAYSETALFHCLYLWLSYKLLPF